jgi:ribosomal protein S12 methylthiotransferase
VPNVVLRTTVRAGFPGETHADFDELCRFLQDARFDYVGVFVYSREAGTPAAQLKRQVNRKTAQARAQKLRDLADDIGFARAEAQLKRELEVLVCGFDEEGIYGRTQGQAPEVDGLTYLLPPEGADDELSEGVIASGEIVRARVNEAILYDLYATALEVL